ncbi:MAG: MBL fold metallo-hydrolase [bacterium]
MKVKFWGVRGSIPAPLGPKKIEEKVAEILEIYKNSGEKNVAEFLKKQPFPLCSTYGGNTLCVELICGLERIVCDMGTGVRELGNSLFKEMFDKGGLDISFLLSHMHWDHIQGLPFFGPLYVNKNSGMKNRWHFYGGTNWMKDAEQCLRGQMDSPTFPVSWEEIKKITEQLEGHDVYDQFSFSIGEAHVTARKLNHPQETYGWRVVYKGVIFAYATDNEPYDPDYPDPRLLALIKDADLLIMDCQYSKAVYEGNIESVPRHGWGHSYPKAVAKAATQAKVKRMALFHHDPASSDKMIAEIEKTTQDIVLKYNGKTKVFAAYEGQELLIGE